LTFLLVPEVKTAATLDFLVTLCDAPFFRQFTYLLLIFWATYSAHFVLLADKEKDIMAKY
jgi:hypothetical protein